MASAAQPTPAEGDEDDLGPAIEVCLEQLSEGDSAAVERLCAAHPERALEIRERIGLLLEMNLVPRSDGAPEFPERLAEFRLLRRLGGGGMGVVYEAVQEPLGRTVALKLIRPEHLYFPRARERFRRETEAVARLAHPGIVAIHTVGESAGVPYFAMELVDGATLDSVLNAVEKRAPEHLHGADLRAVVEAASSEPTGGAAAAQLFETSWVEACNRIALALAEALAHAHSRGVLHRDIKPSNVALTARGRVVLLDFGLASSQDELRLTVAGSALGSVLYMAPEQIAGRTADIDARTDVYALGVTLYELLTLRPPFRAENGEATRAAILDGRPAPLRARNPEVSRDLEVVCLKALERESARRYASMEEFAEDLRAVLEGRAIRARPPSAAANAARWVRRKPALAAALASVALLALGLPLGLYLQQRTHSRELEAALRDESRARELADEARERERAAREDAELEAREAEQVAGFLVELFGASDPGRSGGAELTARELLRRGRERVERALVDQPELAARLLERIGESYSALNLFSEAIATHTRALELREKAHGAEDKRTAFAKLALGKARRLAGHTNAPELLREACETLERLGASSSTLGVNAQLEYGVALSEFGRVAESLRALERARELSSGLPGDTRRVRANVLSASSAGWYTAGDYARALELSREALALLEELHPRPHPARVGELNTLASTLTELGRFDEAQSVHERLLKEARAVYGAENAATVLFEHNGGSLQEARGDLAAAEATYASGFERLRRLLGLPHPSTIRALVHLAGAIGRQGRYEEVRALYEQCEQDLTDRFGPNHALVLFVRVRRGQACEAQGDFAQAERLLRSAQASAPPSDTPQRGGFDLALAGVLRRGADCEAARALASAWKDSADLELALEAHYLLAALEFDAGRASGAKAHLEELATRARDRAPQSWSWAAARVLRARLELAEGRTDAARAEFEAGLAALRKELGPAHVEVRAAEELAPLFATTER